MTASASEVTTLWQHGNICIITCAPGVLCVAGVLSVAGIITCAPGVLSVAGILVAYACACMCRCKTEKLWSEVDVTWYECVIWWSGGDWILVTFDVDDDLWPIRCQHTGFVLSSDTVVILVVTVIKLYRARFVRSEITLQHYIKVWILTEVGERCTLQGMRHTGYCLLWYSIKEPWSSPIKTFS